MYCNGRTGVLWSPPHNTRVPRRRLVSVTRDIVRDSQTSKFLKFVMYNGNVGLFRPDMTSHVEFATTDNAFCKLCEVPLPLTHAALLDVARKKFRAGYSTGSMVKSLGPMIWR